MSNPVFSTEKREKWVAFLKTLQPEIELKSLRLMDEMLMVGRSMHQLGEHSVLASGLSFAKYRILMGLLFSEEIDGRGELNPSEISRRQGTTRNTISALIRDLEDDGLVERGLDQADRRKFNIRLTEEGRALVQEHVRRHFQIVGECFQALDDSEQEMLGRLLGKINQSASRIKEELSEPGYTKAGD